MSVLEARGVSKSFGRHQVLAGVDLAVAAGEMTAVVGENGSGKSTLLRILAGDLRPDAGLVLAQGRVGYCPQATVLDDALTVDQHIRSFQAAYRIRGTERAGALIDRLGYGEFRHQAAGTLSGGTRQKLSLTLALLHQPAVLLLDEPYQGFDWETYLAFWELAGELRAAGTATLVITHLVFEQKRFDRVWHLAAGRIAETEASHAPTA